MLVLLFDLGLDRYAIDVGRVVEVLPLVDLRHLPQAPGGVIGVFDFRGTPVPVLDLTQVTLGRPAEHRLSTRVIVVRDSDGADARLFGLIAERATEAARREASDFVWPGTDADRAKYLGPVATDDRGLLQLVDVQRLLDVAAQPALCAYEPPSWSSQTSNAS